ncbi:serine/threonine protein kinase [Streptomyces sp. NBC_01476]|uniref:serine/threonine-protein kinase n=1 Tax=Streptomyces sp. NBC_01476 TaxID=2903881 RepID=UPI002E332F2C|nr:serine/threonine-protein kinase [Streptomyces sp. NBC_01476]
MDELRADDPRWIGAYRLLGRLGSGSMGRVYLARSARGRTVAVKLVRAELAEQDEFRGRFRREVLAARRVGGTWTAPVLDADTEAEVPWVATGYVAGSSLQQIVAHGYGPLPERSVRMLASGLAHALADIHAAGLVHRDLKPSNVMITIDGPKVIDFGIARALETVADGALTHTGAMVGSPAFMSPEQVRGDRVTPACDIFCLGSVLAYAATGLQPFGAAASGVHAQMFRIVQEPPDLDAVPEGLRELVTACLAKAPEARPSLDEVQGMLGADGKAGRQAGAGTARLTEADDEPWLPGAIVAELGREVVRLLELEAAETGSLPAVPAPSPMPGPDVDPHGAADDADDGADTDDDSGPAGAAVWRRGTLVAVLALLVVIAGGATAYIAVREGGDDSAEPRPAPTGIQVDAANGDLPAGMVGTWRTTITDDKGAQATRKLDIHRDGSVELRAVGNGYQCAWRMRVESAGPPVRLSASELVSGPATSCTSGEATTLTLLDPTHLRRATVSGDLAGLTYRKS